MSNDHSRQNSTYLAAVDYAFSKLGEGSFGYWDRIRDLVERGCDPTEICFVIDNVWNKPAKPVSKETPFKAGAKWGDSVLLGCVGGNKWRARCSCKKVFVMDVGEDQPRRCPKCQFQSDLANATTEVVTQLVERAATVAKWHDGCKDKSHEPHEGHDGYGKLVYWWIQKAIRRRAEEYDPDLIEQLSTLVWEKIALRVGDYDPAKAKVSTFISMIADGVIQDFFKVRANRQRLEIKNFGSPIGELDAMEDIADLVIDPNPHYDPNVGTEKTTRQIPAKPVAASGASGHAKDPANNVASLYDQQLGYLWSK